jgi:hypothetical protein
VRPEVLHQAGAFGLLAATGRLRSLGGSVRLGNGSTGGARLEIRLPVRGAQAAAGTASSSAEPAESTVVRRTGRLQTR